jgi:thiosulfate/3-mercaptopyruvate sulfurtransferase
MSGLLSSFAAVILGAAGAAPAKDTYPNSRLLMEPGPLAKAVAHNKVHVVDTRPLEKYKAGHILHATRVDPAAWSKQFLTKRDKAAWEKLLGGVGIDVDTTVVVYGDDFRETARVWWILRYWGVRDVRMLNGGWQGWLAEGGKQETGVAQKPYHAPKKAKLTPLGRRLAVKDQLLESLKTKHYQIADARSRNEYCGVAKTAKRNGAIPGAHRLEWSDLIDKKTQRFKSPAELTRLLKKAGIDLDKPTVTYCQSGGRASVLAFALELMGAKDVRNYYRSWSEWGNTKETPIEKPEEN